MCTDAQATFMLETKLKKASKIDVTIRPAETRARRGSGDDSQRKE